MSTFCIAAPLVLYILGFIPMYLTVKLYETELFTKVSPLGYMAIVGFWPFTCMAVAVAYITMKAYK